MVNWTISSSICYFLPFVSYFVFSISLCLSLKKGNKKRKEKTRISDLHVLLSVPKVFMGVLKDLVS